MNRIEDAKKKYEDIPVPEVLGQRVQAAVARSKKQQRKKRITRLFYRAAGRSLTAAAAVVAVFYPDGKYKYRICGYGQRDSCCRRGG